MERDRFFRRKVKPNTDHYHWRNVGPGLVADWPPHAPVISSNPEFSRKAHLRGTQIMATEAQKGTPPRFPRRLFPRDSR